MKKRTTGKGAAGLAESSTEGLPRTAAAAPKPKKPTKGERIKTEGGFYTDRGDVLHKTNGIMWSLHCAIAYSEGVMLARFIEAYRLGRKDSRRAIAAAVRKERERCVKIVETSMLLDKATSKCLADRIRRGT